MSLSSVEIEGCVLASMVHIGNKDDSRIQHMFLKLSIESFSSVASRDLFLVLHKQFTSGLMFDYVTIHDLMNTNSMIFFMDYFDNHASFANLNNYVQLLLDYQELRRRSKILHEALNIGTQSLSPQTLLTNMDNTLHDLNRVTSEQQEYVQSTEQIVDNFLNRDLSDKPIQTTIPGFPPIPNKALITVAARSGVGKTMFALYLMDEILQVTGKSALYFNLEMDDYIMLERHSILLGGKGDNVEDTICDKIVEIHSRNISYVSRPMITIEEIETCSRLQALKSPLAVIVVDYIGLITSKNKSERNDLQQSNIAKRLAALSLDLNCRVIALSQVNRDYKTRAVGDRIPYSTDSAESMGTVHSSTWWIGIDRPEVDNATSEWNGLFQVRCRKNRGKEGLFAVDLDFTNGRFSQYKRSFRPAPPTNTSPIA